MDRRKTDLPAYSGPSECEAAPRQACVGVHTAYASRSPLGSEESGVGCPRVVVGDAAQMASVGASACALEVRRSLWPLPDTRDIGCASSCARLWDTECRLLCALSGRVAMCVCTVYVCQVGCLPASQRRSPRWRGGSPAAAIRAPMRDECNIAVGVDCRA